MCIALPMKVLEILPERRAVVSFDGVERRISLRLLEDCQVGDYVLIHAGYAIERISQADAAENERILKELKAGLGE